MQVRGSGGSDAFEARPTKEDTVEFPGGARLFRGPGHEPRHFRAPGGEARVYGARHGDAGLALSGRDADEIVIVGK